jgi:hypothetical protein
MDADGSRCANCRKVLSPGGLLVRATPAGDPHGPLLSYCSVRCLNEADARDPRPHSWGSCRQPEGRA